MQTVITTSGYRLIADTFKEMVGYLPDEDTGELVEVARVKEVDVIGGTAIAWKEEVERIGGII